ncbi:MarR family winged helix-turn-helix transcriptional regulator [Loigolactobacillus iwatensis]|uniref:MarR family winged helix-turn-helix transcriptional regulator n=1 Tax=Loigolactobacillus iwatensis TaxID=1267156 RepID=UPI000F7DC8BE|nr:MarR family transcriptional regulator [Loigolactobacillus iwatensis]
MNYLELSTAILLINRQIEGQLSLFLQQKKLPLTLPELNLILLVGQTATVNQHTIAQKMLLADDEITRMVRKLIKLAYLTREQDTVDHRKKLLNLSTNGQKILVAAQRKLQDWWQQQPANLLNEELAAKLKLLAKND